MPPALSDDEASDVESALPVRLMATPPPIEQGDDIVLGEDLAGDNGVEDGQQLDEDDEEEGEDLDEDEFVVESIKKHMVDEDGSIKFHVKWEGYEKKSDMTWEPEDNLKDSASVVLTAYLSSIGGREAIFQESQTAASTKKRSRTSSAAPSTATKRSRKNGVHPGASTPPATAKSWSPPAGSWEDDIESIDACEDEGSGKLVVYLVWRNGKKTKHTTDVIYKKCPQKMLQFYERHVKIIRDENRAMVDVIES